MKKEMEQRIKINDERPKNILIAIIIAIVLILLIIIVLRIGINAKLLKEIVTE